ncbi:receptor-like protein EIX2 [Gossypium hirsutum]|uniref:Receptor-like protein EIX2 n=1 Tax=Gossypium hirsutum TaxID=3635 RepID=A0ABM2ZY26_GOSHI|nr:receptor-like protein EIX2 [Gossypium hirsutum]
MFSVGKLEWLSHLSRLKEVDLSFTNLSNANDWSQVISHLPLLQNLSQDIVIFQAYLLHHFPLPTLLHLSPISISMIIISLLLPYIHGCLMLAATLFHLTSQVLDLGYNLLNGSISKSLGQLSNLQVLRLAGNCFDGDVISEAHFSDFTNLQELDLSYTSLNLKFNTGWIPPFPLSQIKLCSCKLGPRFPDWLRTKIYFQPVLDYLDISASGISDFLPYWFLDKFQGLSYINMSFNQISGTFPNNSVHIIHLDLSSNNFSGPLPRFSLDFMEMGTINLSKNKFTGPVSPICNITGEGFLALFDLSNNLFSGVVPDCFGSFPFLTALNLGDNSFSGSLPRSLGSLISLEMLRLRGNKFSGVLPSSLQNCAKLKFLDLSDNEFEAILIKFNNVELVDVTPCSSYCGIICSLDF